MKRGAENQLTKDGASDDEIEETSSNGFKKADEATLASRPIRGLPKRSFAAPTPPVPADTDSTPKFTGFAGFGNASVTSTGITPPESSFLFKPLAPASTNISVAPTASATAKSFASFLGGTSTSNSHTKNGTAVAVPTQTSAADAPAVDDDAAFKYYKSLRGLNVSFKAAVSKATEDDPFADFAEILKSYTNLRLKIEKDFDAQQKSSGAETSSIPPAASQPAPLAMPVPPAKFSGFDLSAALTTSTTRSNEGGFTPQITPSTSGFQTSSPIANFTSTPLFVGSSPFSTVPSQDGAVKNPFSFPATSGSSTLRTEPALGTPTAPSSPSLPTTKTPSTSTSSTFTFGQVSSTSGSSSSIFSSTASSTSTNSVFGSSASTLSPPKTNPFGGFSGFGKPSAGNLGNPVGFGFGSLSNTSKASENGASTPKDEGEQEASKGDVQHKAPSFSSIGSGLYDQEGPGEEDEDTLHSAIVKVFRMKKPDEKGGEGWCEMGIGVMRVKKHRESEARRLLLRDHSTGKIILNVRLHAGLGISRNKKSLTFVAINGDKGSQMYYLKMADEEKARSLKEVLDEEIGKLS